MTTLQKTILVLGATGQQGVRQRHICLLMAGRCVLSPVILRVRQPKPLLKLVLNCSGGFGRSRIAGCCHARSARGLQRSTTYVGAKR